MNNLSRKAAVVGVYEHPTRFAPDKTVFQIMAESMKGALDDAGLTVKDVDGVCTAGMGGLGIIGLCDYLNLTPNYVDSHFDRRMLIRRAYRARGRGDRRGTMRGRRRAVRLADFLDAIRDRHRRRRWQRRSSRAV